MSTRKSRLKQVPQPVRGGHCFSKIGVHSSERVGLMIDVRKAQKRLRIPRRRIEASMLPASKQTLPLHNAPLWGAFQRCMVEPDGSSAHLPQVPFHTVDGCTSMIFPFVWKRQRRGMSHQQAQHSIGTTSTFWGIGGWCSPETQSITEGSSWWFQLEGSMADFAQSRHAGSAALGYCHCRRSCARHCRLPDASHCGRARTTSLQAQLS